MKDYSYARKVITESQLRLRKRLFKQDETPLTKTTTKSRSRYVFVRATPKLTMEDFWSKLKQDLTKRECWIWQGKVCSRGYAEFKGKAAYLQTFPAAVLKQPNEIVCHHCDNKLCVNPHHLYLGTHSTNLEDRYKKTNASGKQRHNKFLARLTLLE